jgi:RNA polymerase sigma factor (sigma-70 family)
VTLFRAGNDDAFRAIHDRYRPRMLAYARQMLNGSAQDPEDAVQEVFVRAYAGLRASHRELALRAWLYRIAHNRCIDELRRPHPPMVQAVEELAAATHDPVAKVEERDSLRRLIADVQRLPDQQRSALLMRELGGMAYTDVAGALGVSVPAVKSLLVRARIGLAQASQARDTACAEIREDMISSHDRGVRTSGLARRHMRDCPGCRQFRSEVRGVSRRFAALTPTLGPLGLLANLLGWGGGGGGIAAGGGAVAGGGAAAASGGAAASAGALAGGTGHVVTLLAAAIVATGGAVEIQHTLTTPNARASHSRIAASPKPSISYRAPSQPASVSAPKSSPAQTVSHPAAPAPASAPSAVPPRSQPARGAPRPTSGGVGATKPNSTKSLPISETMDPDQMTYGTTQGAGSPGAATGPASPNGSTTQPGSASTGSSPGAGPGAGTSTGAAPGAGTSGTGTPGTTGSGAGSATGSDTSGAGAGTGASGTPGGSAPVGSGSGSGSESAPGSTSAGVTSSPTGATKLSTFVSPGP